MAHVDVDALREDIRSLLHFIHEETDRRVVESHSEPDAMLREFHSFRELSEASADDSSKRNGTPPAGSPHGVAS